MFWHFLFFLVCQQCLMHAFRVYLHVNFHHSLYVSCSLWSMPCAIKQTRWEQISLWSACSFAPADVALSACLTGHPSFTWKKGVKVMLLGNVFYVHELFPISFGSLGPQENFSTCDFPETLSLWILEVKQFNFSSSFHLAFRSFKIDLHGIVFLLYFLHSGCACTFFVLAE